MSSVDDRIVNMKFNHSQFQKGVEESITSINALEDSLKLENVGESIDKISSKISIMGAASFAVVQRLTGGLLDGVGALYDKTIGQIFDGGKTRALNMELATTRLTGAGRDVDAVMASALKAVDGTAYGLDEAAVAASALSGAGVKAGDDLTMALRGIAGAAAMSGTGFSDISRIWTKVAGKGKLQGEELNQLQERGIDIVELLGKEYGKTAEEIYKMSSKGQISFEMLTNVANKNFSELAGMANETYTGSLDNLRSALSRIGQVYWTDKFERSIPLFNALREAINEVNKVLTPLIQVYGDFMAVKTDALIGFIKNIDFQPFINASETTARAIGLVMEKLDEFIVPIQEAYRAIFPSKTYAEGDTPIERFANSFLAFAERFKPSEKALKNVGDIFSGLFSIVSIVGKAISFVFGLFKRAKPDIGGPLELITSLLAVVGRFFTDINKGLEGTGRFAKFFQFLGRVISPVIDFIFTLSERFVSLAKSVITSETVMDGFSKVGDAIKASWNWIVSLFAGQNVNPFEGFSFGGIDFSSIADAFKKIDFGVIKDFLTLNWGSVTGGIGDPFGILAEGWDRFKTSVSGFFDGINFEGSSLDTFLTSVSGFFDRMDSKLVQGTLNLGLFATAMYFIRDTVNKFVGEESILKSLSTSLTGALDGLTGAFAGMQSALKAEALLKIAYSIGVMALALLGLALIPIERLVGSVGALLVVSGMLTLITTALMKTSNSLTKVNTLSLAGVIIALAGAIVMISGALAILSLVDSSKLSVAAGTLSLVIGALTLMLDRMAVLASSKGLGKKNLLTIAASILVLSVSLTALSGALWVMSKLSPETMLKGLTNMGAALIVIGAAFHMFPKGASFMAISAALLVVSFAMMNLTAALAGLSFLDQDGLTQGVAALGILLLAIGAVLAVFEGNSIGTLLAASAAIFVVSMAMGSLTASLALLSLLDPSKLEAGVIALSAMLLSMTLALKALNGADVLVAAAAILIISVALSSLTPVLLGLGALPMEHIGKGLLAIAGILGIVVAVGYLAKGALPGLIGLSAFFLSLGASVALIGAGINLMGAGILAIATALALLSTIDGEKLASNLLTLAGVFPQLGIAMAEGILSGLERLVAAQGRLLAIITAIIKILVDALVANTQVIVNAVVTILLALVDALNAVTEPIITWLGDLIRLLYVEFIKTVPYLFKALEVFFTEFFAFMETMVPLIVETGINILISLIRGFADGIPRIVDAVLDFIEAMAQAFIDSVFRLIEIGISILDAILDGIADSTDKIRESVTDFITEMVEQFKTFITDLKDLGLDILTWILEGFIDTVDEINEKAKWFVETLAEKIPENIGEMAEAATDLVVGILDAMSEALITQTPRIVDALARLGAALVYALKYAIKTALGDSGIGGWLSEQLIGELEPPEIPPIEARVAYKYEKQSKPLTTPSFVIPGNSADAEDAGKEVAKGLSLGMDSNVGLVEDSAKNLSTKSLESMRGGLQIQSPSKETKLIGNYFAQGYIQGIDSLVSSSEAAAANLGVRSVHALRDTLNDLSPVLNAGLEARPVITPILDLSEVRSGALQLSNLLFNAVAVGLATDVKRRERSRTQNDSAAAPTSVVHETTFNQYNNSPTPLSRKGIYRDTTLLLNTRLPVSPPD